MEYPKFALILLLMSSTTIKGIDLLPRGICPNAGNFTANGTYQTALTALLFSISTINSLPLTYGFFNASTAVSGSSQTLYVVGFCRGDLTAESCHACLNSSASDIRRLCPFKKAAVLYSENCTFRYSNTSISGTVATDPDYQLGSTNNFSSPDTYNSALWTLLDRLRVKAAGGGSLRKYATGNTSIAFDTIYALTQCTPDLTEQQCSDCLVTVIRKLTRCCAGKIGVRSIAPSCQARYETNDRFFDSTGERLPLLPTTSSPPPPPGKSNESAVVIFLVVALGGEGMVFLFLACCFCPWKGTKMWGVIQGDQSGINTITNENEITNAEYSLCGVIQGDQSGINNITNENDITNAEYSQYDLRTIRTATDDFSDEKKLGEGGFGEVFQGTLPDGRLIAVKRLSQDSRQGPEEFKNEAMLLGKLQHRNLVQLLGFCLEGEQKLLVYEFVPNKSLDFFLFDADLEKSKQLDWTTRYQIACGVARGVLYLHRDSPCRIIHRDLKPSNILLDGDKNPKISDFGLARIFEVGQTQANTEIIKGTIGYIAPEYASDGQFSEKSDVYSFGILFLELISGKKYSSFSQVNGGEGLASYAWKSWKARRVLEVLDPAVGERYTEDEVLRCLEIGLACVLRNPHDRPTMAEVVHALNSHHDTLALPQQSAIFPSSTRRSMEDLGLDHSTFLSAYSTVIIDD